MSKQYVTAAVRRCDMKQNKNKKAFYAFASYVIFCVLLSRLIRFQVLCCTIVRLPRSPRYLFGYHHYHLVLRFCSKCLVPSHASRFCAFPPAFQLLPGFEFGELPCGRFARLLCSWVICSRNPGA